jgi:DNA-directed RNA polymerase subunit alpha
MIDTMDLGASATEERAESFFDLASDPVPSFATLQQERSGVFARRRAHDSFTNSVQRLGQEGEEGRRRGLGLWMLGDFEGAIRLLSNHTEDDVAAFTLGHSLASLGRYAEAADVFKTLSVKHPEEPRPRQAWIDASLEAELLSGDEESARISLIAALENAPPSFPESAEAKYLAGRLCELSHDPQGAIDAYMDARDLDPTHRRNLFRLAHLAERSGLDELALECYESLTTMLPIDRNVMINLGVLYEDLGRDTEAAACFDTVTRSRPTDRRARLYLQDAVAGINMFYDEDMEKKEDRLNQILRIPITDFELTVRARNCLNKMDIMTLGDLVKKSENELLSYKNFGETSLAEIKEILGSKGLRLGMARDEAVASIARNQTFSPQELDTGDPLNRSVNNLKLSIRARRAVENMGCMTLGEIVAHTEEELLAMPNFGVTSLIELRDKLGEFNLKLKGDE